MICITGPPRSGKTTICNELSKAGIKCDSADMIAESLGCMGDGTVDIDCMKEKMRTLPRVLEGHYSHLLICSFVIILKVDMAVLEERMILSGYSREKIAENLDAAEIDVFHSEALDQLPSGRIVTCDLTGKSVAESVTIVMNKIIEGESLTERR